MIWSLFFLCWKAVGWLCWPLLRWHPRAPIDSPTPEPGAVWLHGASLGEHRAIQALAMHLSVPTWRTHSSWNSTPAASFPAPLDVPWIIEGWLDWARPRMLILVEAELWPGWLDGCRRRNIPVYVVNFRESSSIRWWKRLALWDGLTQGVTFLTQDQFGDLKRDAPVPKSDLVLPAPCFVAGSTRSGEEQMLLQAFSKLENPPFLVLAPRHLHRVKAIERLLQQKQIQYARRSSWKNESIDVLLLDTHGELAGVYAHARAAFIGGTSSPKIGGHSPLEAARFGIPLVCGPHRWSNPQAWQGLQFEECSSVDELARAIQTALAKPLVPPSEVACASRYLSAISLNHPIPLERSCRPWLKVLEHVWMFWGIRQASYRPSTQQWAVPVISVGGLSAGGSGKTPIVRLLAQSVEGAVVVSRGYKRPQGTEVRVESDLGDELEMLRRDGVSVVSSPDRQRGIAKAIDMGATMVLLDDAFQHRAVHRDIDIVAIDCRWPTSRGVIPTGWAREPWENLSRADWVWLHNYHPDLPLPSLPTAKIVRSWVQPTGWRYKGAVLELDQWSGHPKVVCGIARPEGLFQQLHNLGITIEEWKILPDHSPLPNDIDEWICSTKDAARLPPEHPVWALECQLITEGLEPLLSEIHQCVG